MNRKVTFRLADTNALRNVLGHRDSNLIFLEEELTVDIHVRNGSFEVTGDPIDGKLAEECLRKLHELAIAGEEINIQRVRQMLRLLREAPDEDPTKVFQDTVIVGANNKKISPRTRNQKAYVDLMRRHDVSFGLGPAGTGKTYLAVAYAVSCLLKKKVRKIILTRPAVEAGERLGFLPGDLEEKVSPYLRPLYDALDDMLGPERCAQLMERNIIEIAPLAFMRGRTLSDSFVILDEAQNATRQQMKMFLTRIGEGTRAVITGDMSQVDLPTNQESGLIHAVRILSHIDGIAMMRFERGDVVRHALVRDIIEAYDEDESQDMRNA